MRFRQIHAAMLCIGVVLGLLLATPLLQQVCHAQATNSAGAIQGTISDQKGGILPGAQVTITSLATGAKKILVTDSAGFYSVASLVPGQYFVTVTDAGFSKTTTTLTVQIGITTNGDLKLKIGAATETVEVSTDALRVNTVQSTVEGVLTAQQIDTLPIGGRNFLDLSQLEPGVQLQSGETFDPTKAGYSSISFNGVNGRTARIMLDGQDISDETVGTTTLNVSQGSIEEFNISRSSLDISNELTSSGAVSVSTRSGTNQFHGQGFGLFRDERSGAAPPPGGINYPFQRNQMGGRVGGPIFKDKLFIFGSAERIKQDAFNAVQQVPLFSAYDGGYDAPFRDNYYASRADYNGPKNIHMFARIAYEDNLDDATFGYGYSRYGNKDNTPAIAGGADFITGRLTHSIRGSYLKFHNGIADESAGTPLANLGIELFNNSVITGPNLLAPQQTYQSDKQLRYDAGWNVRNHVFNFGVSINRILGGGFASFFGFAPEVDANFNAGYATDPGYQGPDPTAYPASDIIMGNGEGYNTEHASFGAPAGGQADWRLGIYFGDTWKVFPKLTVNYGIRYSRDTGRSDSDLAPIPCSDAVAVWGAASPCTTGNLLDALEPGLGAKVRQPNDGWGPKAGIAYDLKGDGKTVIRGGMGLYYENNIFNNVLFDRPTRLKTGLFFSDDYEPSGTKSVPMPDGTSFTTFSDGTTLASLWNDPISVAAPYFAQLSKTFQADTKAAGAAANSSYVANSLSEGPNGEAMYVPNFRTPRSVQMNIGVQREVWRGGIFSADYVRNVGEHIMQAIDKNHVGDASLLEIDPVSGLPAAAMKAIGDTLSSCGSASIDLAIVSCPGLYQPNPNLANYHPSPGVLFSDFAQAHTVTVGTVTTYLDGGLDSGNSSLGGNPAAAVGLTPDTGAAFPGFNPLFGQMRFNLPLGRSVYNGLQTNLRQSARVPLPGLKKSAFEVSYTLSRFVSSGGADQNFSPLSVDNNNPLGYVGPAGTDRTHMLSYGGTFEWIGGFTTSFIGHYYSAFPQTLFLDNGKGSTGLAATGVGPGEIFSSDITGDGSTGDILPGYKAGAFMRSIKPSDLGKVIANYNLTSAGKLTPAGQTLVSNGLFTTAELTALGAVTRTIAPPPPGNVGNGSLRTFDLTVLRPIHIRWLGPETTVEPGFSAFNLFNLSNFNNQTTNLEAGNMANTQTPGAANGTDSSLASRDSLRAGNGSGVFGTGVARVIEYQLKINF